MNTNFDILKYIKNFFKILILVYFEGSTEKHQKLGRRSGLLFFSRVNT